MNDQQVVQNVDVIEDDEFWLEGNLNINEEIDIKENPKKHQADEMKKKLRRRSSLPLEDNDLPKVFIVERKRSFKLDTNQLHRRISTSSSMKRFCKKYITYDDIYLDDDMFVISSNSFPGDFEESNPIMESFIDYYDNKEVFGEVERNHIRYNSYGFAYTVDSSVHTKYINTSKKNRIDNNQLMEYIANTKFEDEDEKVNENISLIGEDKIGELNYYSNKNKCKFSFISINLFIKKIAIENLKTNFPILYKSFINQFIGFLNLSYVVEKIIGAYEYYNNLLKIETPDLIDLLNKIVSNHYKEIKEKSQLLLEKLTSLYRSLEDITWMDEAMKKETENISSLLSSEKNDDFDVSYTKYLVSDRRRNKGITVKNRGGKSKISSIKPQYFYIFDFSEEEIARNLTYISYKMMSNIEMNELWNYNFSDNEKHIKAPNVMKVMERFDKLSEFIIEDICSYDEAKTRAELIVKWANIANKCKQLRNFNDSYIINNCLCNSLLKRLVLSWKKVPESTLNIIADLTKFFSSQNCYINVRRAILKCKGHAYIPYFGILLKEIIDIEEKYKYMIDKNNINCIKIQKIFFAVQKFFGFKNFSFTLKQVKELEVLNNITPKSETELEELINSIEPKPKIFAKEGCKKRQTKTDASFYN